MNRAREMWEGLGRNNQIILVASCLGVFVALIGFIAWASTPEYVPLFSNLSAPDANSISDKLREANVPFRLQQGGTAIEVPSQSRDEMRMKIMSQGLPQQSSASLGYELLDKGASIGETQPREAATLLRVQQGEIAKSIQSLQQVQSATVHIAAAEDSPFATEKHPPSAAVFVNLKPGQSLSDENVRAVVRLTQMSYTGLAEKNISVVDGTGNLLYDGTHASEGDADARMKEQHQLALNKRSELQTALDNTIGPHKSVVMVNVELNSDQQEIKSDVSDPGATTSTTTETEQLTGNGSVRGGAPGANANISNPSIANPTAPGVPSYASTSGSDGNYKHETSTKTAEPSHTVTHTVKAPGRIEKLTVSALVDSKVPVEQIPAIKQILETAIGVSAGDATRQVTVSQITFDRTNEVASEKEAQAAASRDNLANIMKLAVPLAIMFITLMLLASALRKPMRRTETQLALAGGGYMGAISGDNSTGLMLSKDGTPVPGQMVGSELTAGGGTLAVPGASAGGAKTYEVIEEAFDAQLESILHLARSKPETVAMLVKSWISKEE